MTAMSRLRARAQRYRELAERYDGDAAAALRGAAEALELQAGALDAYEAYEAAARLGAASTATSLIV